MHKDEIRHRTESRHHSVRKDLSPDDSFYDEKGHEHIDARLSKYNTELVDYDLRTTFDELFTPKLSTWSEKQKNRNKRLANGYALPPGVKKADAKAWEMAWRLRLIEVIEDGQYVKLNDEKKKKHIDITKELIPVDEALRAGDRGKAAKLLAEVLSKYDDKDIEDTVFHDQVLRYYEETKKKHPRCKKKYIEDQIQRFASPITAGEAYFDQLMASGQQQPTYSFIFQVGAYQDEGWEEFRPDSDYWKKNQEILKKFVEKFKKENPNFLITFACIHVDEKKKPAHLHLEVVPIVDYGATPPKGKKPIEVSLRGALRAEGYKGEDYEKKDSGTPSKNADRKAFSAWCDHQRGILKELCEEKGYTVVKGKKGAGIARTEDYKEARQLDEYIEKRTKEKEQLDDDISVLTETKKNMETALATEYKEKRKQIDADKKALDEEYDQKKADLETDFEQKKKDLQKEYDASPTVKALQTARDNLDKVNARKIKLDKVMEDAFSSVDLTYDADGNIDDQLKTLATTLTDIVDTAETQKNAARKQRDLYRQQAKVAYKDKEKELSQRETELSQNEANFDSKVDKAVSRKLATCVNRVAVRYKYGYAKSSYDQAMTYAMRYHAEALYDRLSKYESDAYAVKFATDKLSEDQLDKDCYPWKSLFRKAYHRFNSICAGIEQAKVEIDAWNLNLRLPGLEKVSEIKQAINSKFKQLFKSKEV